MNHPNRKSMKNSLLLAVIVYMLLTGCSEKSQNIAQFRGVHRDGTYKETGLLKAWPADGPKLLWETDTIGYGYGSPVVSGNTLYVNGETDSISHLFAFDLKGNLLWKSPNGREFTGDGFSAGFPGSRSTPTVFKGMVYAHSGLGRIACFDAQTGKEIWTKHMVKDFGGAIGYFGYSESLLIDGDYLYCYPGGPESNVVCLDRLTGNVVWKSKGLSQVAAFNSPIMITLPERKLFVTISKNSLFALDAKNGELLWTVKEDSVKYDDEYCNTPIYSEGFIYSMPGNENGKGTFKLKLSPDGKSVQEVWRNLDAKNLMSGYVIVNDKLYTTSKNKKLWCVDTKTGTVVDTLRNLSGSLITADNKLFCYTDNGNVNLIDISGTEMKVTGKFAITRGNKEHMAYPTISKGVLYVRHGKALMAYQIK
jgi:outer membrane protein assembly factor BamB